MERPTTDELYACIDQVNSSWNGGNVPEFAEGVKDARAMLKALEAQFKQDLWDNAIREEAKHDDD